MLCHGLRRANVQGVFSADILLSTADIEVLRTVYDGCMENALLRGHITKESPFSGQNVVQLVSAMFTDDDLPEICFPAVYDATGNKEIEEENADLEPGDEVDALFSICHYYVPCGDEMHCGVTFIINGLFIRCRAIQRL